ncbi:MAG: hypothetical protein J5910_06960 [Lachnospiraceae bacterium]|nr:hypothetical protein [Lachnospiraceae bacterium]
MKEAFVKNFRISEWYYELAVLGYVATLAFGGMRPGVFGAILMVLVVAELIFQKRLRPVSLADAMAIAFFSYQIISVIWLLRGGFSFSVFANEFVSSVLPMVFYFVGKTAGDRTGNWYRMFIYAMLILGFVGLILYIWAPQFYCDWSFAWSHVSKADAPTVRVRMNSVVGSTCLSFLMVAGMLVGAYFFEKKEKKGLFYIASCLLFAILANQRSGLVAAMLVLIYLNVLVFFVFDMIERRYFFYELGLIAVVLVAVGIIRFDFLLKFWYRIISLPTAISERSEQWVAAVNNMYDFWIGNGLGANGHRAIGTEDAHVIADGGLVKLYCENGIVGFSLWAYLMFLCLESGVKNIRKYFAETGILVVGILQSIGSNVLAFQICAPIFWFAAGKMAEGIGKQD